ncbi:MAG: hypothetical protein M3P83_10345 [Actinomycetota bacterium]|nr:hypothetical protein [Actinomycetota bacterium]
MAEPAAGGQTKIAAAKQALRTVVTQLPRKAEVGMRVYGAEVFSGPRACTDTQLVVPIGRLDRPALRAAIASYRPFGETPIAYSLRAAADDLGSDGQRTILLVSDGEETCAADPCAVARDIAGQGIDLKIDVVGLGVGGRARAQLQCIAAAANGTYYDADSAAALTSHLDRLAVRALRPFELTGKRVTGGDDVADSPVIGPGQYVDTIRDRDRPRYYRIPHAPGSRSYVAATLALPAEASDSFRFRSDAFSLRLQTEHGDLCASGLSSEGHFEDVATLVSGTTRWSPGPFEEECAAADTLLLEIRRGVSEVQQGVAEEVPLEILVVEEPEVLNAEALPPAFELDQWTWPRERVLPARGEVVGGTSFSSAPTLGPGSYRSDIVPGELLVYRVRLNYGQQASFRVRVAAATPALRRELERIEPVTGLQVRTSAFGPTRESLDYALVEGAPDYESRYDGAPLLVGRSTPEVRVNNRDTVVDATQGAALAGYYYVAIALEGEGHSAVVPFELLVDVHRRPSGQPVYAGAAAPQAPGDDPTDTPDDPPDGTPEDSPGSTPGDTPGDTSSGTGDEPAGSEGDQSTDAAGGAAGGGGAPIGLVVVVALGGAALFGGGLVTLLRLWRTS